MLIIDRFEGEWAALELGEKTLRLPRELLPTGAQEGDSLSLKLTKDENEGRRRRESIQALADELFERKP